jgi:hypothetical protein
MLSVSIFFQAGCSQLRTVRAMKVCPVPSFISIWCSLNGRSTVDFSSCCVEWKIKVKRYVYAGKTWYYSLLISPVEHVPHCHFAWIHIQRYLDFNKWFLQVYQAVSNFSLSWLFHYQYQSENQIYHTAVNIHLDVYSCLSQDCPYVF